MKVTFLTSTGMYPYDVGGPAIFLGSLSRGLALRLDVKVILLKRSTFRETLVVNLFRNPIECLRRISNSEVLILNSPPSKAFLPVLFLRKFLNRRNILVAHGGLFIERKGLFASINRISIAGGLKRVRCLVVSPSDCLRKLLFRSFGIRSVVIHNGVDLGHVTSTPAHNFRSRNNIIFVGFLSRIKGIDLLLEAVEKLIAQRVPCNLYIIGSGVLEEAIRISVRRKGLSRFVHMMGTMSNTKVLGMIKGADIMVLPSYWENFPTVILEAMACGKPVVATNVGGIQEIVRNGRNGILVPKGNSDALAKSISFLLENPNEAKKLGNAGRRMVKSEFTASTMVEKYLKLIEDVNPRRWTGD